MEYIEREALLLHLNDIWLTTKPTDTMYDDDRQLAMVRCMGLNDAMDAVKSIPAANVREVKRARWIMNDECRTVCSLCGNVVAFVSHPDKRWDFGNFCPNCGAEMKGEAE